MNVLLVTGSRTLARRPEVLEITAQVETIIAALLPINYLVAGDASGPDAWALEFAEQNRFSWECWGIDGLVEYDVLGVRRHSGPLHPLDRNRAMVRSVAEYRDIHEASALCIGFIDPDARTHGTDHTLGLARRAGIWTARYVWRYERFVEES